MRTCFVLPALASLLLLNSSSPLAAQQRQRPADSITLAQGVMAGEVTDSSAILQSRLTSTNPETDSRWTGIPGAGGVARFEVSTTPNFADPIRTAWLDAIPEADYIVKKRVLRLQPATRYYYRLAYGPNPDELSYSHAATFRTLGGPGSDEPFSFAVVTGMNYSFFHHTGGPAHPAYNGPDKHLGYPGLESIRLLQPGFFVGTGDNVYYDHPAAGRAETQHQLRVKHHEQYSQPRFIDLFASAATYWMKDDHDHRFNDSDPVNPFAGMGSYRLSDETYPKENPRPLVSSTGHEPSHELGVRMFVEQLPLADPQDPNPVTYRTHRVNKHLQVWFVEGRDYRSPNDMPDGPGKTIWGPDQKAWLQRTLLESGATYKILISPTPMIGPDNLSKRDSHVNIGGFRHERDEFFRWLGENDLIGDGFAIVCGDRHWQYHAIDPTGVEEYSVGALVSANAFQGLRPGDSNSTDPDATIQHLHFNERATAGFLIFEVGPDEANENALARFTFHDKHGNVLYEDIRRTALGGP